MTVSAATASLIFLIFGRASSFSTSHGISWDHLLVYTPHPHAWTLIRIPLFVAPFPFRGRDRKAEAGRATRLSLGWDRSFWSIIIIIRLVSWILLNLGASLYSENLGCFGELKGTERALQLSCRQSPRKGSAARSRQLLLLRI